MVGMSGARRGFTLIELLTVVAIIAILMGILLPTVAHVQVRMKVAATSTLLSSLETACQLYAVDFGQTPPDGAHLFLRTAGGTGGEGTWPRISSSDPVENAIWQNVDLPSEALVIFLGSEFLQPASYQVRINEITAVYGNDPTDTKLRRMRSLIHSANRNAGPYYAFKPNGLVDTDNDGLWELKDGFGGPVIYNDNNRRTNVNNSPPSAAGEELPQGAYMWTDVGGAWQVYPKFGARQRNKGGVDFYTFGPNGVDDRGLHGSNGKDDDLDGLVDEISSPATPAMDEKLGDKDDINNF